MRVKRCLVSLAALFLLAAPGRLLAQDSDADGLPDAWEIAHPCLMPFVADADVDYDADLLTSLEEYQYSPDLDPCAADTDGDGMDDGTELSRGSNPLLDFITPGPSLRFSREQQLIVDSIDLNAISYSVWTGSEYILSAGDTLFRLDADGTLLPGSLGRDAWSSYDYWSGNIIWTGSEVVASDYYYRINNFARISPDLRLIDAVSTPVGLEGMVWTGSEFGALTWDWTFVRMSPQGQQIGDLVPVGEAHSVFDSSLFWTGSEFALFIDDWGNPTIMTRLSPEGQIISEITLPLDIDSVVWTGSGFLVSYGHYSPLEETFLQAIAPDGNLVGDPRPGLFYTPFSAPGMEQVIATVCDWEAEVYEIVSYASNGTLLGSLGPIHCLGDGAFAWTGSEVAYFESRGTGWYFSTLQIDNSDGDGLDDPDEAAAGTDDLDWDTDDDGMGDGYEVGHACLALPLIPDGAADPDGDGLTNLEEFLLQTDACAIDTDGDGFTDDDEVNVLLTDPTNADTDDDGLTDGEEINVSLTDPLAPDTDGDGVDDGTEIITGSNPLLDFITPDLTPRFSREQQLILDGIDASSRSYSVWTGSEYILSADDTLFRISPDGTPPSGDSRASLPFWYEKILWTGSEVVAYNYYEFARFSPDLRLIATASMIPGTANGTLVWTGSEFGAVSGYYGFGRLSLQGQPIGDPVQIGRPDEFAFNYMIWTGSEFVVFSDYDSINQTMTRLSAEGRKISEITLPRDIDSVVWTGSTFLVSYYHSDIQALAPDGTLVGAPQPGPFNNPFTAPGMGQIIDTTCNMGWGCYDETYEIVTYDFDGSIQGSLGPIPYKGPTSFAWNGNEVALFETTGTEYYFSTIRLRDDGDALDDAAEAAAGTDPNDWDTDDDGLGDGYEATYACLDPVFFTDGAADPDSDGLTNLEEFLLQTNACAVDTDGDGLTDDDEVNVHLTDPTNADTDDDGLADGNEVLVFFTNPFVADTDGDGMSDGFEAGHVCLMLPLTPDGSADADGDGLVNHDEFTAGADPCDPDTDGDASVDGEDCGPLDPNNWASCSACRDADGDGWWAGCDAYVTLNGPDCSPADGSHWNDCGLCVDLDGDLRGTACNLGPDCDESNARTWDTCAACQDNDGDNWWTGCNRYPDGRGPDCNDINARTWNTCATCYDYDGDTWWIGCNQYPDGKGPDCNDHNARTWNTCATCWDKDTDNWYGVCNNYTGINGPDCSDSNARTWDTCATCVDTDVDNWYGVCNNYTGINGPDCSDANPYAWAACATCMDADADTWYGLCDRYTYGTAGTSSIGAGSSYTDLPLSTIYNTCRTEMIYLAWEIAWSGAITSLDLQLTSTPGQVMNNFTIRMKHTTLTNHSTASWQGPTSGWTTVYQTNEPIGSNGWRTFTFSTPFVYNGTNNLMIDISFNNTITSSAGMVKYISASSRSIYYRTNSTSYGDPLNWTGTSNPTPIIWSYIPNLRLNFGLSINGPDCDDTITTGPTCHNTCSPFYLDQDSDLYGDPSSSVNNCVAPSGYVGNNTDCGPTDANNWTMCATCADADGDTWFSGCDRYATINGPDCDDTPTTGSSCTDNCSTFYLDQDADSFGDPTAFSVRCSVGGGYVADWNDCAPAVSTIHPGAPEACDGLDNQCPGDAGYGAIDEGCVPPDVDGDGLSDGLEAIIGTNPNNPDTDGDGLSDGLEYLTLGTDPNGWDSDNDGLPDGFEVANMTDHDTGENLDPLKGTGDVGDDGILDFDGDGILNAHEYWNGTSIWAANPAGYAACGYWGESDGDGWVTGNDRDTLLSASIGNPTDYTNVFPPTGETQDLDGDGWFTGNDLDLITAMMLGAAIPYAQSRPAALEAIDTCAATLAVGSTCHVSVAVLNSMTPTAGRQAGIAVVFTVDPSSTGSATILGGEGAGDLGTGRYDLSTSALSSPAGVSRAVVRADAAGTVKISARVPQCGTEVGVGRSSAEIVLPVFATVTVP